MEIAISHFTTIATAQANELEAAAREADAKLAQDGWQLDMTGRRWVRELPVDHSSDA